MHLEFLGDTGWDPRSRGKLAVHPDRRGGAFSKHFDKAVGADKLMRNDFHKVQVPSFVCWARGRTLIACEMDIAYESLTQHIAASPKLL